MIALFLKHKANLAEYLRFFKNSVWFTNLLFLIISHILSRKKLMRCLKLRCMNFFSDLLIFFESVFKALLSLHFFSWYAEMKLLNVMIKFQYSVFSLHCIKYRVPLMEIIFQNIVMSFRSRSRSPKRHTSRSRSASPRHYRQDSRERR